MYTSHHYSDLTDLCIGLQVIIEYIDTDCKVTSVERIWPVPTLRTKFTSFNNASMEIAKREQDTLEFALFGTHLQCVLQCNNENIVSIYSIYMWTSNNNPPRSRHNRSNLSTKETL